MKYITLILITLFSLSLGACNTVEGIGRDLKAGGRTLENAAQ